ncbi:MAG: rhodanese-like domain-containing protein [Thermodesulfobacteriota bacterium]
MSQGRERRTRARRLFELTVLHEASFELAGLATPGQIARSFLLTVMGGLGVSSAFIMLFGEPGQEEDFVVHRGLGEAQAARLEKGLAAVRRDWFAGARPAGPPRQPHILGVEGRDKAVFPADTRYLVRWTQDAGRGGLLGVGPKLAREDGVLNPQDFPGDSGPDEAELLLNLTDCLLGALSRAHLTGRLAAMGQDLSGRNAELSRRVYQQDTLIQALSEMSAIPDTGKLLESFLLFLMGAAGAGRGYAFMLDKTGRRVLSAAKGVEENRLSAVDPVRLRQTVTRGLFTGGGGRAGYLDDPAALADAGLPEDMPGLWFAAEGNAYGFAGLGSRLDAAPLDQPRREVLQALAGAFVSSYRNASLLEELSRRNAELEETLAVITNCRVEIEGLEKAKERIKEIVSREMGRVSRASWADFAIVLCIAAAVGFLFNLASPSGVELVPSHWTRPATPAVEASEARELTEGGGAVFVDARPQELFKQGHIPGALNLTPALFDFMYGMRLAKVPRDKPVVVYGRNISRLYDEEVAGLLAKRGHKNVRILTGGLSAWKDQGLPVQP